MDANKPHEKPIDFQGGQLTALSVQKGNPDRINIFVDDRFVMGVFREVLFRHGLTRKGMEVSGEQLLAVWRDEQSYRARELAIGLLGQRARSCRQIADYLMRKGFEEEVAVEVVDWLKERGYLNDSLYARQFVESRLRSKPRGKAMLRWELQQKGIEHQTIEETLQQELSDPETEITAAQKLLEKKVGRRSLDLTYEERAKLGQFLMRRGFSGSVAREALRRLLDSANLDND
jgi:regulatory protein